MMDRAEFWAMVEAARSAHGGDCAQHATRLVVALAELPAAEILAFEHVNDELMAESYHWDLWGAAYLLNFGCSNDGFDYFRGWLLSQGRAIWEAALQDPDGLAELPQVRRLALQRRWESWFWCQDILGVAYEAYQRRTGQPVTPRPFATSSVLRLDHPRWRPMASRGIPTTTSSCAGAGRGCLPGIRRGRCHSGSSP
jgi:hypothetical protein